jgi:hypothetical protein
VTCRRRRVKGGRLGLVWTTPSALAGAPLQLCGPIPYYLFRRRRGRLSLLVGPRGDDGPKSRHEEGESRSRWWPVAKGDVPSLSPPRVVTLLGQYPSGVMAEPEG